MLKVGDENIETKHGFVTTKTRSRTMKQIKSTGTPAEVAFRKMFWQKGYRYRINYAKLPGKPDIVFPKYMVAVFIDGEFWHGYNWEEKKGKIKSNKEYWVPKIEANMRRDQEANAELTRMGWRVFRFWEDEIKKEPAKCYQKVFLSLKE